MNKIEEMKKSVDKIDNELEIVERAMFMDIKDIECPGTFDAINLATRIDKIRVELGYVYKKYLKLMK